MALKIRSLKPQQDSEPQQTPYQARIARLMRYIDEEEFLKEVIPLDHPLFVWEPLHVSESITYRLSLRHRPQVSVVGCAVLFNLNDKFPDLIQEAHFRTTFMSVVRALLFWTDAEDIERRENLRLIDESGQVEWQAVKMYVHLATKHLPFSIYVRESENQLSFIFQAQELLESADIGLNLSLSGIQEDSDRLLTEKGYEVINEVLRDQLLIQISRTLLSLVKLDQLKNMQLERKSMGNEALRNIRYDLDFKGKKEIQENKIKNMSNLL